MLCLLGMMYGVGLGAKEAADAGSSVVAGEKTAAPAGGFPWLVALVALVIIVAVAAGIVLRFHRIRPRETVVRRFEGRRGTSARPRRKGSSKSEAQHPLRQEFSTTMAPRAGDDNVVPSVPMEHGDFHTIPVGNVEEVPGGVRIGKLHGQGARSQQQDSFGVSDTGVEDPEGQLLVVCDGMGGLANGGEVSAVAVETVLDRFLILPKGVDTTNALLSLAVDANRAVNEMLGPDGIKKSGSTLVMALVRDGYLSFLSVGDSRICLMRDGELMQLNREHDYEKELAIRAINGDMNLYDALTDPQGKALMSYLGMGEVRDVDYPAKPMRLHVGDSVILMSDGVYNALTDEEMCSALADPSPEGAAARLGSLIEGKAYENQDNYTALVVSYGSA